jgi:hypothetical protein
MFPFVLSIIVTSSLSTLHVMGKTYQTTTKLEGKDIERCRDEREAGDGT